MSAAPLFADPQLYTFFIAALAVGMAVAAIAVFLGVLGFRPWPALVVAGQPSGSPIVHFRNLPEPPAAPGRNDPRRSLRRRGPPLPVLIRRGNTPAQPEVGWVLNRSCGGLGLVYAKPLAPGEELSIRPEHPLDELPWVNVCVKHIQPGSRFCVLGCQFQAQLPWNTLLLFG